MSFVDEVFETYFKKTDKRTKSTTLFHPKNDSPYIKLDNTPKEGYWTHINYLTFKKMFEELEKKEKKYFVILETGCSAHGIKSTLLFDKFINYYNGELYSVDNNIDRVKEAQQLVSCKTQVICSDSVEFLKKFNKNIDIAYLDSYDVNWLNQEKSKIHHLNEFNNISNLFSTHGILLVDDTPKDYFWLDLKKNKKNYNKILDTIKNNKYNGKGAYIYPLLNKKWELILHQYQMLWKYKSISSSTFS